MLQIISVDLLGPPISAGAAGRNTASRYRMIYEDGSVVEFNHGPPIQHPDREHFRLMRLWLSDSRNQPVRDEQAIAVEVEARRFSKLMAADIQRAEILNEAFDLLKGRFQPVAVHNQLADALARIAELESRPPEVREVEKIVERVVEVPMLSPNPVRHMIPDEIRNLMQEGESLSSAKRRLTELLWVEQAELRNLRGTDRENLKREAEIERLLGLFARLGEI